jgi:hypothetical protein
MPCRRPRFYGLSRKHRKPRSILSSGLLSRGFVEWFLPGFPFSRLSRGGTFRKQAVGLCYKQSDRRQQIASQPPVASLPQLRDGFFKLAFDVMEFFG